MARATKKNNITSPELLNLVLQWNMDLVDDFLGYLKSVDRAATTIIAYRHDLNIFFVWNLQHNNNKKFIDITKRECFLCFDQMIAYVQHSVFPI